MSEQESKPKPRRCIGLLGRLFGHQFVKCRGGFVYQREFCFRCGVPAGGVS